MTRQQATAPAVQIPRGSAGAGESRDPVRLHIIALALLGLLRLINLGFLDMQAYDEGLYAMRAVGILRYGGWLDQSPFAVDGLYSALHPPLYVWWATLSSMIFGPTELAIRLPSALCGGITTIIIYLIGRRLHSSRVGLIAALLYALNPFIDFYSRQGQFDAMLTMFLTLAIYLLIVAEDTRLRRYAALAGIAVGAALMSKLFVGFGVPLAYALWIFTTPKDGRRERWRNLIVMSLMALVVAAPWHLYMVVKHGGGDPLFLLRASQIFERTVYGIEGNEKSLEIFYFVNQLFVLFPAVASWFLYGLARLFRRRVEHRWKLLGVWFLLFFIVFSLMRTKLGFYMVPMLVPAALIGAREIARGMRGELSKRTLGILVGAMLVAVIWGASQEWRTMMKVWLKSIVARNLPDQAVITATIPFIAAVAGAALLMFWLLRRDHLHRYARWLPHAIIIPAFVVSAYPIIVLDRTQYVDGGEALGRYVAASGHRRIVVIGRERNPQITYYLDGVDIGWRNDIAIERVMPEGGIDGVNRWLAEERTSGPRATLYLVERDKIERFKLLTPETVRPPGYNVSFESRRYTGLTIDD